MARIAHRLIRVIAVTLAALLLLAVIGVVALLWFIDADVFRPRIQDMASTALGRPVTLGRLHWNIGKRVALRTEDGAVGNPSGFDAAPLASWRSIDFAVDLWPLLREKAVRIDHVSVRGLAVDLQRAADGAVNWEFPALSGESALTESNASAIQADDDSGLKFALGSLTLEDASLRFRDVNAGQNIALDAINLSLRLPEDLNAPQWNLRDIDLAAKFQNLPLSLRAASLRVTPAEPAIDLPMFESSFDAIKVSGLLQATLGDALAVDARLAIVVPALREQMQRLDFPLPPMQDASAPGPVTLDAHFNFAAGALRIDALKLKVDDTTLTGQVELPSLDPLALRFELDADRIDADRYLSASSEPSEPFELPVRELKSIDAKGTLRVGELRAQGAVVRKSVITVE
jgi:AsmA protein